MKPFIELARNRVLQNQLPYSADPDSLKAKYNKNSGELQQVRSYDSNGEPLVDYDFGHFDHKQNQLHAHDYNRKGSLSPYKTRNKQDRKLSQEEYQMLNNNGFLLNQTFKSKIDQLHDESIQNISIDEEKMTVTIKTIHFILHFESVLKCCLNGFSTQNVILSVSIKEKYPKLQGKNSCLSSKTEVNIESSIGVEGVIVCRQLKINRRHRTKDIE